MGQSADQLRQEITAKRNDAAVKIDQIEAKVHGLPQLARETVDATIQQAKASMKGTVGQMANRTANKMSLRQQAEAKPMLALGAAIAGGWLLGKLLGGDAAQGGGKGGQHDRDAARGGSSMNALHGASVGDGMGIGKGAGSAMQATGGRSSGGVVETIRGAARDSGLEDTLQAFTGALVATLVDQLRRTVDQTFPEFGTKLREQEQAYRDHRTGASPGAPSQGQGQGQGAGEMSRTYGQGQDNGMASGSGSAYGTSSAGAMAGGAAGGAGMGPGEGGGYATLTGHGTGIGFGTGASAGAYIGSPSGSTFGDASSGDLSAADAAASLDADPTGRDVLAGDEGGAARSSRLGG